MTLPPLPTADLEAAAGRMDAAWPELLERRILLTGGTGFLGRWLVESFAAASRRLGPGPTLHVSVRDPDRFRRVFPHLSDAQGIEPVAGDVTDAAAMDVGADVVVHGAAPRRERLLTEDPDTIAAEIGAGAAAIAELAGRGDVQRLLFVSSGAAAEAAPGYGAGKKAAEETFQALATAGVEVVVARCYSVLGPGMHDSFAVAGFIGAALAGTPLEVSRPEARRTYLYAGDAAAWLWRLSVAPAGLYEVGSDETVTFGALAELVADVVGELTGATPRVTGSDRGGPGLAGDEYVPDVAAARALGLEVWTSLRDAVRATALWSMDT